MTGEWEKGAMWSETPLPSAAEAKEMLRPRDRPSEVRAGVSRQNNAGAATDFSEERNGVPAAQKREGARKTFRGLSPPSSSSGEAELLAERRTARGRRTGTAAERSREGGSRVTGHAGPARGEGSGEGEGECGLCELGPAPRRLPGGQPLPLPLAGRRAQPRGSRKLPAGQPASGTAGSGAPGRPAGSRVPAASRDADAARPASSWGSRP